MPASASSRFHPLLSVFPFSPPQLSLLAASQPFTFTSQPSLTSSNFRTLFNLCHLCSFAPLRQTERPQAPPHQK